MFFDPVCVSDQDGDLIADCVDGCIDLDGDNYGTPGGAGVPCTGLDCSEFDATCNTNCTGCVICGDFTCEGGENNGTCAIDCPASECAAKKATCSVNADCCSAICKPNGRCR